jgi:P-aminobenzoate N-oxygenase AurF
MYHDFNYEATLASSLRAQWQLDDVLKADQELDFSRKFMPESLVRISALDSLNPFEQRILNQIAAHQYLSIFGIVEEFILPFVVDHARTELTGTDDYRVRAILNFAGEEAKHIQLFKRFHNAFVRGFPVECQMIGPSEAIGAEILRHDPLAVSLVILMIEWMSQQHYLGSIRDDGDIDPLFKSLLKNHWMEEAQHAKLDTLIVEALAEGKSEEHIDKAVDEFFEIGAFLDEGLKQQAGFNLDALERAIGRRLDDREPIEQQQHQAARWTYIGSGMVHERFQATLKDLSARAAERIAEAAPLFA